MDIAVTNGFIRGSTNRWPQLQELAMANDSLVSNPFFWPNANEGDDIEVRILGESLGVLGDLQCQLARRCQHQRTRLADHRPHPLGSGREGAGAGNDHSPS